MKAHVIENNKTLNADTVIHLLVDKSGSMGAIRKQTVGAINEYINSLKKDKVDDKTLINLCFFSKNYSRNCPHGDLSYETVFKANPLEEFKDIELKDFKPDGGTPLYDAIAKAISDVDEVVDSCKKKPDILFIIVTDGMENSSSECTSESVKNAIATKENDGWTVVYLGANQDAWAVGGGFGVARANTMSYNAADIGSTMSNLASATSRYRSTKSKASSTGTYKTSEFFDQ